MNKTQVKISRKGQIAIPKSIRKKLSSDILDIQMEGNRVILKPAESILSIAGSLKKYAKNYKPSTSKTSEDEEAWEKHVKKKFSGA